MTTEDIIRLYSPHFLTIQGSEEVRLITGCRYMMALHVPFSPCKPPCRGAAWGTAHRATCHASKDAFCIAGPRVGKGLWHCTTAGETGGDLKHTSGAPAVLIHRNQHDPWAMASQITTGSSAIVWEWWMWSTTEGFCKMISLSLFSIILGHNLKEWKTISAGSIILPCGFSYWFEDKLLVPKLLDAWMHI